MTQRQKVKNILLALTLVWINAAAFTLQEILELQKNDNKTKSTLAYKDAMQAQNEQSSSYDAPWITGGVAYSKEEQKQGGEFTLSFSKGSLELEQELRLSQRELDIAQKYYSACISKLTLLESQALEKKQQQKIKELENAYALGEISKKELLFTRLDYAKLSRETHNYKRVYIEEMALLEQSLSGIALDRVACSDLESPKPYKTPETKRHHRALKTLEYKKEAALKSHQLHDAFIPKMQYQLLYEHELSMERITLGVSIPLTQLTQTQELLKTEQLKKNAALSYELEALRSEMKKSLQNKERLLATLYDEYLSLKDEILPLSHELLELSEYAYKEGEGSLMEYLDSWRSYQEHSLELLKTQKSYYEELFALYKISDVNYGERK